MSEPVERVARILCRQDSLIDPGPAWIDANWKTWAPHAMELVAALREPTAAMCEAGFEHTADPCWPDDVGKAWRAMIDAALKP